MNYHGYLILPRRPSGRATMLGTLLRPVDRAAVDPLRRHVRAHRRRRRHPAHDGVRRRSAAPDPPAVAAKRWTLLRRGLALYGFGLMFYDDLAGHDPAVLRRDVRRRRVLFTLATPWLVAIGVVGRARRRRHRIGGSSSGGWTATPRWLFNAADRLAAGAAVQRVRQRHPPAAAVARLPVRRHRPRPVRCATDVVATGRRSVLGVTLFGVATLLSDALRPSEPRRATCWPATTRSTAGCSTPPARSARRWSRSPSISTARRPVRRTRGRRSCSPTPAQMSLTLYVAPRASCSTSSSTGTGGSRPAGLDHGAHVRRRSTGWSRSPPASWWHRRFGIGPVEWVYRKLGA